MKKSIIVFILLFIQCTAIRELLKSDVETIDPKYLKNQTLEEKQELSKLTGQLINAKNDMKQAELGISTIEQKIKIAKEFVIQYDQKNEKEKSKLERLHITFLEASLSEANAIFKVKQAELAKVKAEKDFLEAKIAVRNQAESIKLEEYESNLNSKIKEVAEAKKIRIEANAQKKILEEKLKNSGYTGWK